MNSDGLRSSVKQALTKHLQGQLARAIEQKLRNTERFFERPEIHREYADIDVYQAVRKYNAEEMYQTVKRHKLPIGAKWKEGLVNLAMMEDLKWCGYL